MKETLRNLLLEYGLTDSGDQKAEVEEEIWRRFGAVRTVLIWDMSGFSRLTRKHGIIHYLSMVRRMQEVTSPIVHRHEGEIVKFEADNGFAVFLKAEDGIRAAIDMNHAFEEENTRYPDEFDIRVSCGLDHGRIILMEGEDFFGDAVNTASKLGEDIASAGEILVAQTAMVTVAHGVRFRSKPVSYSVSGMCLDAARISLKKLR